MTNFDFSPGVLRREFAWQYWNVLPWHTRHRISLNHYVEFKIIELLDAMITHYGPDGGGRWRGTHY